MNNGVKQYLDTRGGLQWSSNAGLPTFQVANAGADAGTLEGGSNSMAYITSGQGGSYSTGLGAGLPSFAQVCLSVFYIYGDHHQYERHHSTKK